MTVFIASTEKNVGIIKEDIYIKEYFLSNGRVSRIETLDDILKEATPRDVVLLKSIWGYHLNYEKFLYQINLLKRRNVRLINDYEYVRWNIDKSKYLSEINFLKIIPTSKLDFSKVKNINELDSIISAIVEKDLNIKFVIKPSISASGYLTFVYIKNETNSDTLCGLLKNKELDFIIQPFRFSVVDGELSVVLIDGKMMYGIKRFSGVFVEKRGSEYIDLEGISREAKCQVELLINFFNNKFSSVPKICRVDFIQNKSEFEILEVELIDPDLFFKYLPRHVLNNCLKDLCDT